MYLIECNLTGSKHLSSVGKYRHDSSLQESAAWKHIPGLVEAQKEILMSAEAGAWWYIVLAQDVWGPHSIWEGVSHRPLCTVVPKEETICWSGFLTSFFWLKLKKKGTDPQTEKGKLRHGSPFHLLIHVQSHIRSVFEQEKMAFGDTWEHWDDAAVSKCILNKIKWICHILIQLSYASWNREVSYKLHCRNH